MTRLIRIAMNFNRKLSRLPLGEIFSFILDERVRRTVSSLVDMKETGCAFIIGVCNNNRIKERTVVKRTDVIVEKKRLFVFVDRALNVRKEDNFANKRLEKKSKREKQLLKTSGGNVSALIITYLATFF